MLHLGPVECGVQNHPSLRPLPACGAGAHRRAQAVILNVRGAGGAERLGRRITDGTRGDQSRRLLFVERLGHRLKEPGIGVLVKPLKIHASVLRRHRLDPPLGTGRLEHHVSHKCPLGR